MTFMNTGDKNSILISSSAGNSQDQSKRELDASQVIELAESKVKNITVEKSPETKLKNRYSALESKLTKWGFKNQGCTEIPGDRDETASDGWKKTTGVSKHYQSKVWPSSTNHPNLP